MDMGTLSLSSQQSQHSLYPGARLNISLAGHWSNGQALIYLCECIGEACQPDCSEIP